MPIARQFQLKDMTELHPGELIAFELEGPALGITGHRTQDGDRLRIVLLRSGISVPHPCWTDLPLDGNVLSYGADWVLDLGTADGCYPGNYEGADTPGTISVSAPNDRTLLRTGGDGQSIRNRPASFEVSTMRIADISMSVSATVYIEKWRLWLNEHERQREGSVPMFIFGD